MSIKSRYFLYGYFGSRNFGDDILLYSAIKNILAHDPDASFLLRNYGPVDLDEEIMSRVQCTNIERVHETSFPVFIKLFILLKSYWQYMGQVSKLVIGGGTLIHDTPSLKSTFLLLLLCIIAKVRGCSVIGIGLGTQAIETMRGKMIVRMLISMFNKLCIRDQRSYDQLQKLSAHSKRMELTADLAYALPEDARPHSKGKVIAVTLAVCLLKRLDSEAYSKTISVLGRVLAMLVKKGYAIRIIDLQKENAEFNITGDHVVSEDLYACTPKSCHDKMEIVSIEANQNSIAQAYDDVCLVIGMRFHSLVFSAIKYIPFIGLFNEPKIRAICDEFSMPCFDAYDLDENAVFNAIETASNKAIDPKLIQNYRKLSQANFSFIKAETSSFVR